MKLGLSVSVILISFLLAIGGCASAPAPKEIRETRLDKASITKDVTNRQTDSIPAEEASVFSPEDPQALMWVKLDDVQADIPSDGSGMPLWETLSGYRGLQGKHRRQI